MTLSICIFSENQADGLLHTVRALGDAAQGARYRVHILDLASNDGTVLNARALASADSQLEVHCLSSADRANAWNHYTYTIAPREDARAHIFINAGVIANRGSLLALSDALQTAPEVFAAGALPISGRGQRRWCRYLLERHHIASPLYALSDRAIVKIQRRNIQMPIGARDEDGILSYLLLTNLEGGTDESHSYRIINPPTATFHFNSINISRTDFRVFHHRLCALSERRFQAHILFRRLRRKGAQSMPQRISDLYTKNALKAVPIRRDPVGWAHDVAMRRRLSRKSPAA